VPELAVFSGQEIRHVDAEAFARHRAFDNGFSLRYISHTTIAGRRFEMRRR
jgi:hypothetical protein